MVQTTEKKLEKRSVEVLIRGGGQCRIRNAKAKFTFYNTGQ